MKRRQFIGTTSVTLLAAGTGGAFLLNQIACGGKSIDAESAIIDSTIIALKPLLPNQAALLDKIASVNRDFAAAYKKGDFVSARSFFDSLDVNISTLLNDIGAASPRVKFLVSVVSIALHAIAALLNEQATPAISAAAVKVAPVTSERVKTLGSDAAADKLLKSLKQ